MGRKETTLPQIGPVLICAPTGRDAEGAGRLLERERISNLRISNLTDLCAILRERSAEIGAVLLADEALAAPSAHSLVASAVEHQPPWSDVPFIILTHAAPRPRNRLSDLRLPDELGNAMFLERPLNAKTLISAVQTALRSRRRQLQIRDHLETEKQSAEALKHSEAALRDLNSTLQYRIKEALAQRKILTDIIETTDLFVQVADLQYRWLAINRSAADEFKKTYGVRASVGASMLDVLRDQPKHREALLAIWSRALAGEEFTAISEFADNGCGTRFYEVKFNILRDESGERIGAYQFAHDVTRRLRDQERLLNAERLLLESQKMDAVGQLTGGVAHDFNNLLAVISGGLQVLRSHGDNFRKRELAFDGIGHAVERGTRLTRQLLGFSRDRAIHPEPIDLAGRIKGMGELLSSSLRGDVQVTTIFQEGLWAVEVDAGELELAILNLCVNARDAMTKGGTIFVGAHNWHDDAGADFVRVSVKDTGEGMPAEVVARAFEPFYTTKEIGKGSGLGLAQVYAFCKTSGGRVEIDSVVGHGTTVTMVLSRTLKVPSSTRTDVHGRDATLGVVSAGARRHVLLVEDDRDVAALAIEMLESLGFEILHVETAAAALGALANGRACDFVFSDIMMPGGTSGVDLAREIKRRRPGLPVVLTTGYQHAASGAEAEGVPVLLKPYRIEDLAKVLAVDRTGSD
jgi:signal transduction histidine kinase/CheY-like chemotaxis protein